VITLCLAAILFHNFDFLFAQGGRHLFGKKRMDDSAWSQRPVSADRTPGQATAMNQLGLECSAKIMDPGADRSQALLLLSVDQQVLFRVAAAAGVDGDVAGSQQRHAAFGQFLEQALLSRAEAPVGMAQAIPGGGADKAVFQFEAAQPGRLKKFFRHAFFSFTIISSPFDEWWFDGWRAGRSKTESPVEGPELDRFGDVGGGDGLPAGKIGDRPGNLEDSAVGPGAQAQTVQAELQQLPAGLVETAIFFELKHYKPKKNIISTKCFAFMEQDELRSGDACIEL